MASKSHEKHQWTWCESRICYSVLVYIIELHCCHTHWCVLNCPVCNPDLSPTEKIWRIMKWKNMTKEPPNCWAAPILSKNGGGLGKWCFQTRAFGLLSSECSKKRQWNTVCNMPSNCPNLLSVTGINFKWANIKVHTISQLEIFMFVFANHYIIEFRQSSSAPGLFYYWAMLLSFVQNVQNFYQSAFVFC